MKVTRKRTPAESHSSYFTRSPFGDELPTLGATIEMRFKSTVLLPLLTCWLALIGLAPVVAQEVAGPSDGQRQPETFREQTIYIPYEKLRRTFEQQGRGVFLPYEKFQELWQAAEKALPPPEVIRPPAGAVITEIFNEALVQDDVVRVTARLRIDLLGKGWIEVPLRLSDAALLSATIANEPALIVSDESGGQKLLVHKTQDPATQIELRLEYAKSITKEPAQNSVEFQPPLAPVNRWRIQIPESGVKVNVHPMLAASVVPTEIDADDETKQPTDSHLDVGLDAGQKSDAVPRPSRPGTEVLAFVGAAASVRIDWTSKAEGASGLDALVSVQTEQEVTVDEGVTRTRIRLNYEISRAELSQLKLEVPADQRVVNVADANLRQWNVEVSDQTQTITLGLFQPAQSAIPAGGTGEIPGRFDRSTGCAGGESNWRGTPARDCCRPPGRWPACRTGAAGRLVAIGCQ